MAEDAPLRPLSQYGHSKLRAERLAGRLAGELGMELVVLRYFTVYGPRQRPDMAFARFVGAALEGGSMPLLGDGSQVRDFTYVGDAADATALALGQGRDGGVYNVAGGAPATLAHAFELLGGALGTGAGARVPSGRRARSAQHRRGSHACPPRARLEPRHVAGRRPCAAGGARGRRRGLSALSAARAGPPGGARPSAR